MNKGGIMFNLEKAIKKWRKCLRKNQTLEDGYIEEIEQHLRDSIESNLNMGMEEEAAFEKAVEIVGEGTQLSSEYYKSVTTNKFSARPSWQAPWWMPVLIWNYLKVALRNFNRYKGYSFINVAGLALSVTVLVYIFLWISNELSYDKFHSKSENIYRAVWEAKYGNNEWAIPLVSPPLERTLKNKFPEVESAVSLMKGSKIFQLKDEYVEEKKVLYTTESFFEIFDVNFIHGSPGNLLNDPSSVVITEEFAKRFFGDKNATGRTLKTNSGELLKVKAVVESFPQQSHFKFNILASLNSLSYYKSRENRWGFATVYTYALLNEGIEIKSLQESLNSYILDEISGANLKNSDNYDRYYFQALEDIHLHSGLSYELQTNGNILYVYILTTVAVLILLLAIINFANLASVRSIERLNEIGIRKVLGAEKKQVINQFLAEAFFQTVVAVFIGITILFLAVPAINSFTKASISSASLINSDVILLIISLSVFIALSAGSYPAFYISKFNPARIIKKQISAKPHHGNFRKILVSVQFILSTCIIAGTLVVISQLDFIKNKNLGFDKEHVLIVKNLSSVRSQLNTFKNEITSQSGVVDASAVQTLPSYEFDSTIFGLEQPANYKESSLTYNFIDEKFVDVLKLNVIEGRNFSKEFSTDSLSFLINESAAKAFGWDNPIGKKLGFGKSVELDGPVIGVIEDFNFRSLHKSIEPIIFPYLRWSPNYFAVRLQPGSMAEHISRIEEIWKKYVPNRPFEYTFLDEQFAGLYQSETNMANVLSAFALISIFIASIGLYGLSSIIVKQRYKEIAVRKVMGATVSKIFVLVSKEFFIIVFISSLISLPVSYSVMSSWLNNFAYKTELGLMIFIASVLIVLTTALISTGLQAIKAAIANPVNSIKYE